MVAGLRSIGSELKDQMASVSAEMFSLQVWDGVNYINVGAQGVCS